MAEDQAIRLIGHKLNGKHVILCRLYKHLIILHVAAAIFWSLQEGIVDKGYI